MVLLAEDERIKLLSHTVSEKLLLKIPPFFEWELKMPVTHRWSTTDTDIIKFEKKLLLLLISCYFMEWNPKPSFDQFVCYQKWILSQGYSRINLIIVYITISKTALIDVYAGAYMETAGKLQRELGYMECSSSVRQYWG